jgi:queuosine precursor transporter
MMSGFHCATMASSVPTGQLIRGSLRMPRSLFVFSLIYGGLVCMAGVLGTKIVVLGPLTVEAGIFAFLQLVILSSAISELHGTAVANRLVRYGFIPLILSALLIQLVIALPAASFWNNQTAFVTILGQGSRMMVAGLISYGLSQTLNVALFDRLKSETGKMIWLRGMIAAVASQIVDTLLFVTIAFYGVFPITPLLISAIIAKMLLSVIMVPPFIQLAVRLGRKLDAGDALS